MLSSRSSWQITRSVWYALFLRESVARTTADRMAWFWMLAEPIAMVVIMVLIRAVAFGNGRYIVGADFIPWLIVGLFGFHLFRDNMMRSIGAVDSNKGLFSYRQVKPIDSVFVRCYLEGVLKSFVFVLFIIGGVLLELELLPADPLWAVYSWICMWLLGAGAGLTLSALSRLIPEIGRIVKITSFPLLIISGVIFPLNFLPHDIQQYLLYNPIVHGLENLRMSFFPAYRPIGGVNLLYMWYWILCLTALGMALHIRFEAKLKAT